MVIGEKRTTAINQFGGGSMNLEAKIVGEKIDILQLYFDPDSKE